MRKFLEKEKSLTGFLERHMKRLKRDDETIAGDKSQRIW